MRDVGSYRLQNSWIRKVVFIAAEDHLYKARCAKTSV